MLFFLTDRGSSSYSIARRQDRQPVRRWNHGTHMISDQNPIVPESWTLISLAVAYGLYLQSTLPLTSPILSTFPISPTSPTISISLSVPYVLDLLHVPVSPYNPTPPTLGNNHEPLLLSSFPSFSCLYLYTHYSLSIP
jgi:hypothetical protein